jgi:phosphatidylserine decarboxylase
LATNEHPFKQGFCSTIYLAPCDYHRVHMPIDGFIKKMSYIPGKLNTVNPNIMNQNIGSLSLNERVIVNAQSKFGEIAIILVGAMNVGSIWIDWHGNINPNYLSSPLSWIYDSNTIQLKKGQELGYFSLGSTVVILFENPQFNINNELKLNSKILLGQSLGY